MPSIIILHGWGLSGQTFAPLVRAFHNRGYSAWAPDLPGFGKSALPKRPLHLADYADFLHDYIHKKTIQRPILVGHSFGGRVALKYAALHPDGVRALILTGTPGFTPVARSKRVIFIGIAKIGNVICSIYPLSLMRDAIRRWYYCIVGAREFYRAQGTMRETFKNIVKEELVVSMKENRAPTLLLWGERDAITPVSIAKKMKDVMPHASLQAVPDVGHGFPFTHAKAFVSHVLPFISSI